MSEYRLNSWLAGSTVVPQKQKQIDGVSRKSVVDLKAAAEKSKQQAAGLKDGSIEPGDRRKRGLDIASLGPSNSGVRDRDERDKALQLKEVGVHCHAAMRHCAIDNVPDPQGKKTDWTPEMVETMEKKAALYDALSETPSSESEQSKVFILFKQGRARCRTTRKSTRSTSSAREGTAAGSTLLRAAAGERTNLGAAARGRTHPSTPRAWRSEAPAACAAPTRTASASGGSGRRSRTSGGRRTSANGSTRRYHACVSSPVVLVRQSAAIFYYPAFGHIQTVLGIHEDALDAQDEVRRRKREREVQERARLEGFKQQIVQSKVKQLMQQKAEAAAAAAAAKKTKKAKVERKGEGKTEVPEGKASTRDQ